MKSINSDTWIQLLGMLCVLAGLVFVGLEMQQSQRIALANTQQEGTNTVIDGYMSTRPGSRSSEPG
mgnify:CR=1 FL=1